LYKSELASQWFHWKVCSEGFGKEYIVPGSAFWINAEIIERVFKFPMPVPIFYEHLIIDGKKMSASLGNVVYPSDWLKVATPELLRLLFLKDPMRVRDFRWDDIPRMFSEYDNLERIYYEKKIMKNERDRITFSRLFEMIQVKPLSKIYQAKVPFNVLLEIVKILPEKKQFDFVLEKLKEWEHVKTLTPESIIEIKKRFEYVKNWYEKFGKKEEIKLEISDMEVNAIRNLIDEIKKEDDGEKLQTKIFDIARNNNLKPAKFFKLIYQIILKSNRGPRLGPYIIEIGKEEVIRKLKEVVKDKKN
jgi:lysyl-tRNA synthetase class 1